MPSGWLGWDWGNVPSWVGSVLTSTSLVIAAGTYARSAKDRRQAREDAERGQAARVSLWWANPRKAWVRNGNDVSVVVQALIEDEVASAPLSLGPGETRALQLPGDLESRSADVALAIVDSHGRSWVRRTNATLDRTTHPLPVPERPELRWEDR